MRLPSEDSAEPSAARRKFHGLFRDSGPDRQAPRPRSGRRAARGAPPDPRIRRTPPTARPSSVALRGTTASLRHPHGAFVRARASARGSGALPLLRQGAACRTRASSRRGSGGERATTLQAACASFHRRDRQALSLRRQGEIRPGRDAVLASIFHARGRQAPPVRAPGDDRGSSARGRRRQARRRASFADEGRPRARERAPDRAETSAWSRRFLVRARRPWLELRPSRPIVGSGRPRASPARSRTSGRRSRGSVSSSVLRERASLVSALRTRASDSTGSGAF
jgi:hypothetical protein